MSNNYWSYLLLRKLYMPVILFVIIYGIIYVSTYAILKIMEFLREMGALALASRLKLLSELLSSGVSRIYDESKLDFEPRWFAVTYHLYKKGASPVTSLSKDLGISHPAVVQVVNTLVKKGYVNREKSKSDARVHHVSLSEKGRKKAEALMSAWENTRIATERLLDETSPGLLVAIKNIEDALAGKDMFKRITEVAMEKEMTVEEAHKQDLSFYKDINFEWLKEYLGISDHDREILEDPENTILKDGGKIYIVLYNGQAAATFTLIPLDKESCELSKLALRKDLRGRGLGRAVLNHAIECARRQGFSKILLFTHEKLVEASSLYRKAGFKETNAFETAQDLSGRCSLKMLYEISNSKPLNTY